MQRFTKYLMLTRITQARWVFLANGLIRSIQFFPFWSKSQGSQGNSGILIIFSTNRTTPFAKQWKERQSVLVKKITESGASLSRPNRTTGGEHGNGRSYR